MDCTEVAPRHGEITGRDPFCRCCSLSLMHIEGHMHCAPMGADVRSVPAGGPPVAGKFQRGFRWTSVRTTRENFRTSPTVALRLSGKLSSAHRLGPKVSFF
jgi:hypothetical protein